MAKRSNPLKSGWTKAVIDRNIAEMVRAGHPARTAVAAAYQSARVDWHKAHGDSAYPRHLVYATNPAPSKKVVKRNPAPAAKRARVDAAIRLYQKFSGHEPKYVTRMRAPQVPDVGLVIGHLDGVAYIAERDGRVDKYFHRFSAKARPLLVSSHDGHSLYIVGGRYNFTADGIVG